MSASPVLPSWAYPPPSLPQPGRPLPPEPEELRRRCALHAIRRAQEHYCLHLTLSDIDTLSAEFGTPTLVSLEDNKPGPTHGTGPRVTCWSVRYCCLVGYDRTLRVVVTFLPPGHQPWPEERIPHFARHTPPWWKLPALALPTARAEKQAFLLGKHLRQWLTLWYLREHKIPVRFGWRGSKFGSFVEAPNEPVRSVYAYYRSHHNAIWRAVRERFGEEPDPQMAI